MTTNETANKDEEQQLFFVVASDFDTDCVVSAKTPEDAIKDIESDRWWKKFNLKVVRIANLYDKDSHWQVVNGKLEKIVRDYKGDKQDDIISRNS